MTPHVTKRPEGNPIGALRAARDIRETWTADLDGADHVRAVWPALARVLDVHAAVETANQP